MSKTKIMKHSKDAMEMITKREIMVETGAYETVKSTPSRMDDKYAHVM